MGQTYLGQEKWGPAITEFAKAAKLRPENFDPHYGAGAAFLKLRHLDKATIALETAPGQNTLGVMLPYTPLHFLLFNTDSFFINPPCNYLNCFVLLHLYL